MLNLVSPLKILVLVSCLLLSTSGFALEFPDRPSDTDFYIDKAGIINADAATEINLLSSKLLQEEQIALFVVTITSFS